VLSLGEDTDGDTGVGRRSDKNAEEAGIIENNGCPLGKDY